MNKIGMKIWLLVGWLAIVPQLNGLDQTISIPDIKTFIVSGQSAVDFIEIFNTDPVKSEYTGTIKPQGHYQPAGRSSRGGKGHTWYTYTFQIKDANSEIIQSLNIGTTQTAHIAYTTSGTPSSGVPIINLGDSITFEKISSGPPPGPTPKTVTVNIPAGTANFKNVNIMDGNENPDIASLFNGAFSKDLLTNGLTVTGVIVNNGINWTYSGGTTSSSTKSKPIELDMYFNPGGGLKPGFNVGDTIEIVGIKPPSETPLAMNMPTGVGVYNFILVDSNKKATSINNWIAVNTALSKGTTLKAVTTTNTLTIYDGNLDTSKIISTTSCASGATVSAFRIDYDDPYGSTPYPLNTNTTYAISVTATPDITVTIPKANLPIAGLYVLWDGGGTGGLAANECKNDKDIIIDIGNGKKITGKNTGDTLTLVSGTDTSVGKTGTDSAGKLPIAAFQYNYNNGKSDVRTPLLPGQGIVLQLGT